MKSIAPFRILLLGCLVLALAASCGKKSQPIPEPKPDLTERDADDLAEWLGASIGSNQGGWWFLIEQTCAIIDQYFPVPIPPGPGLANAVNPAAPFRVQTDTTVTQVGVTYRMSILYSNFLQVQSAVPDTSTDQLESITTTDFGSSLSTPRVTATYGLVLDPNEPVNLSVVNLYPNADTLEFSATITDSSYALINSSIHPGEARVWYHYDNFFDFTLFIRKADLPNARVLPSSEVTWQMVGRKMPDYSGDRTVQAEEQLATATMTFDGTQVAKLTVADSFDLVHFNYTVDLKTGFVTKAP